MAGRPRRAPGAAGWPDPARADRVPPGAGPGRGAGRGGGCARRAPRPPAPLRVAALAVAAGAPVAPGTPVLTATSATPVVNVALPAAAESLVHPGQRVTVT